MTTTTQRMTPQLWKEQHSPIEMLNYLSGKVTPRKLRLFACACTHQVRHLMQSEAVKEAVLAAEQFADDDIPQDRLRAAAEGTYSGRYGRTPGQSHAQARAILDAELAGINCAWLTESSIHKVQLVTKCCASALAWLATAELPMHELHSQHWNFANLQAKQMQCHLLRDMFHPFKEAQMIEPYVLKWNGGAVVGLAKSIYQEKRFDEMPILADALEDAGCWQDVMINHCREHEIHARGCWVLDLILGKR